MIELLISMPNISSFLLLVASDLIWLGLALSKNKINNNTKTNKPASGLGPGSGWCAFKSTGDKKKIDFVSNIHDICIGSMTCHASTHMFYLVFRYLFK